MKHVGHAVLALKNPAQPRSFPRLKDRVDLKADLNLKLLPFHKELDFLSLMKYRIHPL